MKTGPAASHAASGNQKRGGGIRWLGLMLLVAGGGAVADAADRPVLIVAGQSNVLNWHADAAALPPDPRDHEVAFYFHSGAPPSKSGTMSTPFNATSGGAWTTLRAQRQEPYSRYAREFFGPEISLARKLRDTGLHRLAVVKTGYFGTTLAEDWRPGASSGNRLYRLMFEQVQQALALLRRAGDEPRVVGFFWMQGETDGANATHAEQYEENLRAFVARVRADFAGEVQTGASEPQPLPFVLGRVGPPPPRGYPFQDRVRAAQVRVAESVPGVRWVDTDDLGRDTDNIHLLPPGVLTLGERWAEAWRR